MSTNTKLLVTGATGQLGRLVIDGLLERVPAQRIVAGVRNHDSDAARAIAALGVELRSVDYSRPDTLAAAFAGVDRLLLISSNELGGRLPQHRNVIDAAKAAGVGLVAYTSLLHADSSPFVIAEEHRQTEALLRAAGLPHVVLRNGWYHENYLGAVPAALAHGAWLGSAGDGRISSAARADYAEAAAVVLTSDEDQNGRIYELAGDDAYSLAELAAETARLSGKPVPYRNVPVADYKAALLQAGLPEPMAALFADFDAGAATGTLEEAGGELGRLLGRPTTPILVSLTAALNR